MQLYSETGNFKLYQGSMLDMLEVIAPNSIDSIVTDPPYGLTSITKRFGNENAAANVYGRDGSFQRLTRGFMGKEWDGSGIELNPDTWRKCYTVLKSGGYLLAFGGTRTFHRIACAIEDAGFEIRDTIMWLYGSGFPKSMNIGLAIDKKNGVESKVIGFGKSGAAETHTKTLHSVSEITGTGWFGGEYEIRQAQNEWAGWGTALKPAYEPVIVARKPCEGSCVDNVMRYGVGGLNIDGCRVGDDVITTNGARKNPMAGDERTGKALGMFQETEALNIDHCGRYPANVILTYDESDKAEVCGGMPETKSNGGKASMPEMSGGEMGICNFQTIGAKRIETDYTCPMDEGSAARYYYCAKASKRDRDEGLELFENSSHKNTHPTVKPTDLMQYLIRLVTPPSGTILDPFNGSGSTGKAAMYENKDRGAGYRYIGIELTAEYLPIADARIRYAAGDHTPIEPAEQPLTGQITFFDLLGGAE